MSRRRFQTRALGLAIWLAAAGCGGGNSPEREVFAARISSADELLSGRMTRGRIGDYKIWNRHVSFVIADSGLVDGYGRYGGRVVDADVTRAPGEAGASQLGDLFFGFNQRLFEPASAEILSDGSDGRAAVRFVGRDALFAWLASFLGDIFSMDTIECEMRVTYSLGPTDRTLRIDIELQNRSNQPRRIDMMEAALIMGDGLESFFPGAGFDKEQQYGEFPLWAGMGERLSYGLLGEGPLDMIFTYSNIAFGTYPVQDVPGGGTLTLTRHLAVAEGGVDRVQAILRDPAEPFGTLSGSVQADAAALSEGLRLHVLSEGKPFSVVRASADGTFAAELPPGSYTVIAKAHGHAPTEAQTVEIAAGQTTQFDATLPTATPVSVEVTSGGQAVPARVGFYSLDGQAKNLLAAYFGEETHEGGAALTLYLTDGRGQGALPPGRYRAVAMRGFEYEMDRQEIELGAEPKALRFDLVKAVDTTGWVAADFHLHAQYSPDSSVHPLRRVATALAAGMPILAVTEHDTVRDFRAVVESIPGASDWIFPLTASEITTYYYGHFNAWPLTEKPDALNHGGIEWFDTPAPALLARMRDSEDHPIVIQVNHPRSESIGGYFSAVGLDILAGTYERADWWSEDLDAIEVFNGTCSNGNREEVYDWFAFLNRGYRVAVSGGSDSHQERVGIPRVYLPSPHTPSEYQEQESVTAVKDLKTFVSCGPFVRFSIDGHGLGETVPLSGALDIRVRVEAPSWMSFDEFRLVRNGEVALRKSAAEWTAGAGGVRCDEVLSDTPAADAWYVLEVKGTGTLSELGGEPPYAITNPIFVDADGNGRFDPPLPKFQPR
ncbi:MAG: CehA/McbA family metallohydrolase [Myxococcales bacterium]|nr:CehA/McbA family metallohydrolase [Myxococcales bacterium]